VENKANGKANLHYLSSEFHIRNLIEACHISKLGQSVDIYSKIRFFIQTPFKINVIVMCQAINEYIS